MGIHLVRCNPTSDREAYTLATRAWPETERTAFEQAIRQTIEAGQETRIVLVAAYESATLLAAQLAQALPGKVAVIWHPCFSSPASQSDKSLCPSLFERVTQDAAAAGAQLAQALSAPDDVESMTLFERGGFHRVADLLYLAASSADAVVELELPFQLEPVHDDTRLEALIERTYVGSLDCPSLDGLRETSDVLAGYRAVGVYRPDLWRIARSDDQDVGCLLLNLHPDVKHAEVVYLALAPGMRGRGWGLLLAKAAKQLARETGFEQVVLAVDATNRPAIELYERAGFWLFDRRVIWIRELRKNP